MIYWRLHCVYGFARLTAPAAADAASHRVEQRNHFLSSAQLALFDVRKIKLYFGSLGQKKAKCARIAGTHADPTLESLGHPALSLVPARTEL